MKKERENDIKENNRHKKTMAAAVKLREIPLRNTLTKKYVQGKKREQGEQC